MAMNRVEIRCATENMRSRAVPERLGFKARGSFAAADLEAYAVFGYGGLWDAGRGLGLTASYGAQAARRQMSATREQPLIVATYR